MKLSTPLVFLPAFLAVPTTGWGQAGPWVEQTISPLADGALSVFAADVDGDGDLDALSASWNDDTIAWHENTAGDGSAWSGHAISTVADGAWAVFAADVDGDGDSDILSASEHDDTIAWYENTVGDGTTWSGHTISTVADGARAVFAVDLDGDGDVDVLSASWSVGIAWHENTAGDGTAWSEHLIHPTFRAGTVFAEDVDGDGDVDIVGPSGGGGIAWYENTPGIGSGWIRHSVSGWWGFTRSVFASDVDGDGDVDLLLASSFAGGGGGMVLWFENTAGDGSAWDLHAISTLIVGPTSVFTADVDGDGGLDVLSACGREDRIAWYENTHGSGWVEHVISTSADGAGSVFAADLDGDGDVDALSASWNDDTIAWYENSAGDGSAWTERTITSAADGARSVFVADVDGDGDPDALSASWRDDTVAWHENAAGDGTTWVAHAVSAGIDGARTVFAADVDGDGDVDALSTASGRQMGWPRREYGATWHENTAGDGSAWTEHVIIPPGHSASSVFAGDVDGDGDLDALFAAAFQGVGKIVWYENTVGDGSVWSEHPNPVVIASARSIFAGDLDGDGDLDVLGAFDASIAWYENTAGDGSIWIYHSVSFLAPGARSVFGADVDGDGDLDAVSASFGNDTIAWHENTSGDGSTWSEHRLSATARGAQSVFAADVDGDGALEVLSASRDDDRIAWYDIAVEALEMLRLGTPPNPLAFLPGVTSGPVIGALWDPVLDHSGFQPGAAVDLMAISPTPLNLPTPLGTLLCAIPPPGLVFTGPPSVPFSVPIPLDGSLVGHTLCSQGGSVTAAGAVRLANAIDIRIGTF